MVGRFGYGQGKLILFGEHTAVYGAPASGIPLPESTILYFLPHNKSSDAFPDWPSEDVKVFKQLLKKARAELAAEEKPPLPPGVWKGDSRVPRTGGFGSSAALCTALARVCLGEPGETEGSQDSVRVFAQKLESFFHGTPSGIDIGMAGDSEPAAWYPSPPDIPRREPLNLPPLSLVYGALSREKNTGELVGDIKKRKEAGDPLVTGALHELQDISKAFIDLVQAESKAGFFIQASLMVKKAQKSLDRLGVTPPDAQRLFDLAHRREGAAGKLSGAGGGGAFFFLLGSHHKAQEFLMSFPRLLARRDLPLALPLQLLTISTHGWKIPHPKPPERPKEK